MNTRVKQSLNAALDQFSQINGTDTTAIAGELSKVFDSDKTFLEKVADLDEVFDQNPALESLREVFF